MQRQNFPVTLKDSDCNLKDFLLFYFTSSPRFTRHQALGFTCPPNRCLNKQETREG